MKKEIQEFLLGTFFPSIEMDKPLNFDEILEFIVEDVNSAADPEHWHSGDVVIAFRRWIESNN